MLAATLPALTAPLSTLFQLFAKHLIPFSITAKMQQQLQVWLAGARVAGVKDSPPGGTVCPAGILMPAGCSRFHSGHKCNCKFPTNFKFELAKLSGRQTGRAREDERRRDGYEDAGTL